MTEQNLTFDFVNQFQDELIQDSEFMNHAFSQEGAFHPTNREKLDLLIGEAEQTLLMIVPYLKPGMRILEIGGGVGLVYALLRSRGFDIISLEPGSAGFGDRHRAGFRLM